jgi:hypothetical protein
VIVFRNAWLVDMGFVVKAATDGGRFKLDYVAARGFLERRLGPTDVHLFNSIDSSLGVPAGLESFYSVVRRQGFKVRLIEMTGNPCEGTHRQMGVDDALIRQFTDSARSADISTVILTSGDSHFVPAADGARKAYGKRVILFAYDVNVSTTLKSVVDEFWPFEAHEAALARTGGFRDRRTASDSGNRVQCGGTPAVGGARGTGYAHRHRRGVEARFPEHRD